MKQLLSNPGNGGIKRVEKTGSRIGRKCIDQHHLVMSLPELDQGGPLAGRFDNRDARDRLAIEDSRNMSPEAVVPTHFVADADNQEFSHRLKKRLTAKAPRNAKQKRPE
jgi:hypothetical protein